jgi:hypothetical protein
VLCKCGSSWRKFQNSPPSAEPPESGILLRWPESLETAVRQPRRPLSRRLWTYAVASRPLCMVVKRRVQRHTSAANGRDSKAPAQVSLNSHNRSGCSCGVKPKVRLQVMPNSRRNPFLEKSLR